MWTAVLITQLSNRGFSHDMTSYTFAVSPNPYIWSQVTVDGVAKHQHRGERKGGGGSDALTKSGVYILNPNNRVSKVIW